MTKSLQKLKDELSIIATGMTKSEATEQGICIKCKKPPTFSTEAGQREYGISGMCEPCWDELFAGEDE
jgi:hypothetical protein